MNTDEHLVDYLELRSRGETPQDAALRKHLGDGDAESYEAEWLRCQQGRAA
jgi:hypothetical protein